MPYACFIYSIFPPTNTKYSFLKQGNLVTFYKFDISENNREIVSESGLMTIIFSRLSEKSWGRSSWGLNQWGMRGDSAFGPTLYQRLSHSPQGSSWRSTCIIHLIVWGGNHFSLWRVLEHLASTVFWGKLTPLKPDRSLARRSLPQRRAFSSGRQIYRPKSCLRRSRKQCISLHKVAIRL